MLSIVHLSNNDINGGAARAAYRIHQCIQNSKNIYEVNKFLKIANDLFQDEHKSTPKYWKSFNSIFKKDNLQRKDCLLLPVNALKKIINRYD